MQENKNISNEKSFSLTFRYKIVQFDQFIVRNRCNDLRSLLKYHFGDTLKPFDSAFVPAKSIALFGLGNMELVDNFRNNIFAPLLDGQIFFIS